MSKLRAKFEALQRTQRLVYHIFTCDYIVPLQRYHHICIAYLNRHLLGEDLGPLSVKELQQLEKQLECALSQARQRKVHISVSPYVMENKTLLSGPKGYIRFNVIIELRSKGGFLQWNIEYAHLITLCKITRN